MDANGTLGGKKCKDHAREHQHSLTCHHRCANIGALCATGRPNRGSSFTLLRGAKDVAEALRAPLTPRLVNAEGHVLGAFLAAGEW